MLGSAARSSGRLVAMSKFKTSAKARTAIPFELDEVKYTFRPPKSAAMVMPLLEGEGLNDTSVVRAGLDWLREGLEDEQYAALVNRLKDPKDDFDLPDLEDIIEYLVEQAANDRPIL